MAQGTVTKNFKLVIQYDGANYHGWQVQNDVPTIQGVLEGGIERVVGEKLPV